MTIFFDHSIHQFISNVIWTENEAIAKMKNADSGVGAKRRHKVSSLFKDVVRKADKRKSNEN